MKKGSHPQMNPVIFRDPGAGADFLAFSTLQSDQKETVDGVEYSVIIMDVSSASHNFYTGKQNLLDTSGRVEKFKKRQEEAQKK